MNPLLLAANSWRPFIDPIDAHGWWFLLLIPMSLLIAIAYKAVRSPSLDGYWRLVIIMTIQTILGMLALAAALYIIVQIFVPMLG